MIRLEHVSFGYEQNGPTVKDVSFHIRKGEFAAILGANGAGKTTTVKLIDGLIRPTSGRVYINGADTAGSRVSERARHVGEDHARNCTAGQRNLAPRTFSASSRASERFQFISSFRLA